jgi:putative transposase
VKILREADQTPLEVAKKHRISDATVYLWRKRYGELAPLDVKRLRHLEQENAKLEKLAAERDLEIEVMKQLASSGNNPDKAIS